MTDETDGYVTDIGYLRGYFQALNPIHMRLALLREGLATPDIATACELGYGHGLSLGIHAAASLTEWYGTDFNLAHADFARELAVASGAGVRIYNDSFADFANRSDLPDFDFIGLHGVWSWISEQNRIAIVDFVRRRLKPGGVLYLSYNTLPGWAPFMPLRQLLIEHEKVANTDHLATLDRVDGALSFAARLLAAKSSYLQDNHQVAERLSGLKKLSRNYVAHEYFNCDWHPMHFASVSQVLTSAGLDYACPAAHYETIEALSLTHDQRKLLAEFSDPDFRESMRDFLVNRLFRREYWIKGARRLSPSDRDETLRRERVALIRRESDLPFQIRAALALNRVGPGAALCAPILSMLAHHGTMTLGEIQTELKDKYSLMHVLEAVTLIAGSAYLVPAQDDAVTGRVRHRTDRLNALLIEKARDASGVKYLASPVTGGGIRVDRYEQFFLEALRAGKREPDQWAWHAWHSVSSQGDRGVEHGDALKPAEANLMDLKVRAQAFAATELPILRSLQIA